MSRALALACLALLWLASAAALAADDPPLRAKMYFVPPGFIGGGHPAPLIDARTYLKSAGIEIPPNGEAAFDSEYDTLAVRAPEPVIKQVDALMEKELEPLEPRGRISIELTLVEFAAGKKVDLQKDSYERVRQVAGASWRVLDRISLDGKSGQRFAGSFLARSGQPKPPPQPGAEAEPAKSPFRPGEYGTRLEAEPVMDQHGIIDLNLNYHHRRAAESGPAESELECITSVSLRPDTPAFVQTGTFAPATAKHGSTPAREWALVLRAYTAKMHRRKPSESATH